MKHLLSAKPSVLLGIWLGCPLLAAIGAGYLSHQRFDSHAHLTASPPPSMVVLDQTAIAMRQWRKARQETDPVRRIQGRWAAWEAMTPEQHAAIFTNAIDQIDHETVLATGEAWVSRNPEQVVRLLQGVSEAPFRRQLLNTGFQEWSKRDPKAAFDFYHQPSDEKPFEDFGLSTDLMIRFLAIEPTEVSRALASIGTSRDVYGFLRGPSEVAFTGDVTSLATSLHSLIDTPDCARFTKILGNAILAHPDRAQGEERYWRWWLALPADLQSSAFPRSRRMSNEPDQVVRSDKFHRAPPEVREPLAKLAVNKASFVPDYMHFFGEGWSETNASEAFTWVVDRYADQDLTGSWTQQWGSMTSFGGGGAARGFEAALTVPTRHLARENPQQAVEMISNLPYLQTRSRLTAVVAAEWASADPHAALAWIAELPAERVRYEAEHKAIGSWAEQDLAAATAHSLQNDRENDRTNLLWTISQSLRGQTATEQAAWLTTLPENQIDSQLRSFIPRPPDPARVASLLQALRSMPEAPNRQALFRAIDQRSGSKENVDP